MEKVEVLVTIETCGETKSIAVKLLRKEIAKFSYLVQLGILHAVDILEEDARVETKQQATLAREYRRGCRDGRQEAYSEVAKQGR